MTTRGDAGPSDFATIRGVEATPATADYGPHVVTNTPVLIAAADPTRAGLVLCNLGVEHVFIGASAAMLAADGMPVIKDGGYYTVIHGGEVWAVAVAAGPYDVRSETITP